MTPLESDLEALAQALAAFNALLGEEGESLASADSNRLDALLPRRDHAQAGIQQAWRNLTARLGLPAQAGLVELRGRLAANSEAVKRLEQLAEEGSRLNRINGQLIEEQMRRTQAALQVLQNAASRRGLYGSDGRVSNGLNLSRTIDTV